MQPLSTLSLSFSPPPIPSPPQLHTEAHDNHTYIHSLSYLVFSHPPTHYIEATSKWIFICLLCVSHLYGTCLKVRSETVVLSTKEQCRPLSLPSHIVRALKPR